MRSILFFAPAAMLVATAVTDIAAAAPARAAMPVLDSPITEIQYRDCHNRTRNHYVQEWGFSAPHHHRQSDCRAVQDENDSGARGYYRDDDRRGNRRRHDFGFYPSNRY
jgi:hypothetical protein